MGRKCQGIPKKMTLDGHMLTKCSEGNLQNKIYMNKRDRISREGCTFLDSVWWFLPVQPPRELQVQPQAGKGSWPESLPDPLSVDSKILSLHSVARPYPKIELSTTAWSNMSGRALLLTGLHQLLKSPVSSQGIDHRNLFISDTKLPRCTCWWKIL